MPPRRKAAQAPKPRAKRTTRRVTRQASHDKNRVPDEFRELLAEAEDNAHPTDRPSPPLKRRRIGERPNFEDAIRPDILPPDLDTASDLEDVPPKANIQTVTRDSDSDESEIEFEDVAVGSDGTADQADGAEIKDVSIALQEKPASATRKGGAKKSTVTAAERRMRLDIHKMHICCLLQHEFVRNSYCNDHVAQKSLRGLLSDKVKAMLLPKREYPQSRRTALFMDGLNAAHELWKGRWRITHIGVRRPRWVVSADELRSFQLNEQVEVSLNRQDLRRAAKKLAGSADLGAQLLCTLLRSVGVTARLVCSLQPLPFVATATGSTPRKATPQKTTVYANASEDDGTATDATVASVATAASSRASPAPATSSPAMPRRIARFGQARPAPGVVPDMGRPPPVAAPNTKRISPPRYPVYWVEAFDEARQKWIAVDSLATQTVGKQSRLEPPFNDPINAMTYVVAFEADGSAKDVTRRYARAYNAKTRRLRVESVEGGERWWRKALKLYRRRTPLDRDIIEDAELARKEAAEGMPRNVQDFKNHPYYVLERHVHQNEIIHPMTEVGKINSGGAASGKLESVYRRKDVHVVRSADKWYRFGREVKAGEQPLKHGKPRMIRRGVTDEQEQDEDEAGVALYAAFQTDMYVPPPVVRGKVPRNAFGNLDVYVSSMVPLGGIHIKSRDAVKAARALSVDYAEAVTGFKFQGRQGTAIVEGVIVAEEHGELMMGTIAGFEQKRVQAAADKKSAELLRLWRRFIIGLRVVERLQDYKQDSEEASEERDIRDEIDRAEDDDARLDEGGGFFVDEDDADPVENTEHMATGAIAEAIPYEDLQPHETRNEDPQYFFLPRGIELVGFEGIELKPVERPARRLLAFEDSDEDAPSRLKPVSVTGSEMAIESSRQGYTDDEVYVATANEDIDGGSHLPNGNEETGQVHTPPVRSHEDAHSSTDQPTEATHAPTIEPDSSAMNVDAGGGFMPEDDEEEVEKGSLLSYDPDDVDADPEWLDD